MDDKHVIKDNLFDIPPLFKLIQEQSHTDWKEMFQVFNCGHRMELYVNPSVAEDIIAISKSFNVLPLYDFRYTLSEEYGINTFCTAFPAVLGM